MHMTKKLLIKLTPSINAKASRRHFNIKYLDV